MITKNGKAYLCPAMAVYAGGTTNIGLYLQTVNGRNLLYAGDCRQIRVDGGRGATPATPDDINLAYPLIDGMLDRLNNASTQRATPRDCNDNFILTASTTYQNTTDQDITIQELGIFLEKTDGTSFLLARQVINPVTLEPGKTYTFTMTVG